MRYRHLVSITHGGRRDAMRNQRSKIHPFVCQSSQNVFQAAPQVEANLLWRAVHTRCKAGAGVWGLFPENPGGMEGIEVRLRRRASGEAKQGKASSRRSLTSIRSMRAGFTGNSSQSPARALHRVWTARQRR